MNKLYKSRDHFKRIDAVLPKKLDVLDGKKYVKEYVKIFENLKYQVPEVFLHGRG
jgi:hypothetical protein